LAPTTTFDRTTVTIDWVEPFNQGSDITGYQIFIRESDGITFTEDLTDCNRLTSAALSCTLPVASLTTTPYTIAWAESIYAKVAAINVYGISLVSDEGNGALIYTYPDAPVSFAEDYS
jgi:hypothetical protein